MSKKTEYHRFSEINTPIHKKHYKPNNIKIQKKEIKFNNDSVNILYEFSGEEYYKEYGINEYRLFIHDDDDFNQKKSLITGNMQGRNYE